MRKISNFLKSVLVQITDIFGNQGHISDVKLAVQLNRPWLDDIAIKSGTCYLNDQASSNQTNFFARKNTQPTTKTSKLVMQKITMFIWSGTGSD